MEGSGPAGGGESENPFEGIPFLGDLAKLLPSSGPVAWDVARQFATSLAGGGAIETNPEPLERIRLEELLRVAELRVVDATGLNASTTGRVVTVLPVTKAEWARRTLDAHRPFFERLATSLTPPPEQGDDAPGDPTAKLLNGLFTMIGPLLLAWQAGAIAGRLAERALGQYDLPLPRPSSDELLVVSSNIEAFADEWSLPGDDVRLWVCLSELTTHAVLGVPHVRARLEGLVLEYVGAFQPDPSGLELPLDDVDPSDPNALEALGKAFGDPTKLLGAMQSPQQRDLLPRLEAIVAVVVGYVDHVMDEVGGALLGSYAMLSEALRRRRVEASEADRLVERLFGLELGHAQYERGGAFVRGVVERSGAEALGRLWTSERELPTPAEVDAPGLWLARIDL